MEKVSWTTRRSRLAIVQRKECHQVINNKSTLFENKTEDKLQMPVVTSRGSAHPHIFPAVWLISNGDLRGWARPAPTLLRRFRHILAKPCYHWGIRSYKKTAAPGWSAGCCVRLGTSVLVRIDLITHGYIICPWLL